MPYKNNSMKQFAYGVMIMIALAMIAGPGLAGEGNPQKNAPKMNEAPKKPISPLLRPTSCRDLLLPATHELVYHFTAHVSAAIPAVQ